MDFHLRLETPADYHMVEEMTREAFWTFWETDRKICDEHLLVHMLRDAASFPTPIDILLNRLKPEARKVIEERGFQTLEIIRSKSQREKSEMHGIDGDAIDTIRAVMQEHGYRWGK